MRSTEDEGELEQVIVMAHVIDPVERKGGMRLNAAMKAEVVQKAMDHGFKKRLDALKKEELQLSKLFHLKAFGPAVIKHVDAIKDTPFVRVDVDVYGRKLGSGNVNHSRWNIGGQTLDLTVPAGFPVVVTHGSGHAKLVIKDEALIERCRAWQGDTEKYNKDHTKTRSTLQAMLDRITTYPSLEKNWPAGVKFYKHLPAAYPFRHQVPAVMIDELNAALGVS